MKGTAHHIAYRAMEEIVTFDDLSAADEAAGKPTTGDFSGRVAAYARED